MTAIRNMLGSLCSYYTFTFVRFFAGFTYYARMS